MSKHRNRAFIFSLETCWTFSRERADAPSELEHYRCPYDMQEELLELSYSPVDTYMKLVNTRSFLFGNFILLSRNQIKKVK